TNADGTGVFAPADIDLLVAETAKKVAATINDLKCKLDNRHWTGASARGKLELTIAANSSRTYELSIASVEDGEDFPTRVEVKLQRSRSRSRSRSASASASNGEVTTLNGDISTSSTYRPTRCGSDAGLEKDLIPRKRGRLDGGDDPSKRQRT